jgi:hypothetical protein
LGKYLAIEITRQGYWLCKKPDGSETRHVAEPEAFEEGANAALANPGQTVRIVPAEYRVVASVTAPPVEPPPPPPPPVEPPPPTGAEPYALGAVPFAYSWPAPPVPTRTIQVATMAQFQAAVQQSGVRIVVAAGTYQGNLNVTGSDLDIVATGATIRGGVLSWGNYATARPARVRWTGGDLIDGGMVLTPVDDLLVNGFNIDNLASVSPEGLHNLTGISGMQPQGWNRQAWINSTIRLRGGSGSGGWAFYSSPMQRGNGNLILANVKVQTTGGQNNRFMGITNLIIVDSVFNPDGLSANGMRIHDSTTNVYMRDSWVRGIFKLDQTNTSDTGPQVLNAHFLRVAHYDQAFGGFAIQGGSPNTGTVRESTVYSGAGGGTPSVSPMTGSGNRHLPWDGVTVPDYSAVGARR